MSVDHIKGKSDKHTHAPLIVSLSDLCLVYAWWWFVDTRLKYIDLLRKLSYDVDKSIAQSSNVRIWDWWERLLTTAISSRLPLQSYWKLQIHLFFLKNMIPQVIAGTIIFVGWYKPGTRVIDHRLFLLLPLALFP